jgi:hypothetical protein
MRWQARSISEVLPSSADKQAYRASPHVLSFSRKAENMPIWRMRTCQDSDTVVFTDGVVLVLLSLFAATELPVSAGDDGDVKLSVPFRFL